MGGAVGSDGLQLVALGVVEVLEEAVGEPGRVDAVVCDPLAGAAQGTAQRRAADGTTTGERPRVGLLEP